MRRTVIVTGASRGIGRAIALDLAGAGYDLWLAYRSRDEEAQEVGRQAQALGAQCRLLKFDIGDAAACEAALVPALKEAAAPPWGLVNNAGATGDGLFIRMSPEQWGGVIATCLGGFFNVTKPVVAAMLRKREGRIVNIGSIVGLTGNAGQVNYSAAKAGLVGATKALAQEVAVRGILVNCVAPGFIETDMTKDLAKDDFLKRIPLGRLGKPEDVACAVRFLLDERNTYMTGQVLSVNGGMA